MRTFAFDMLMDPWALLLWVAVAVLFVAECLARPSAALTVSTGGKVKIAGDFTHDLTNAAAFNVDTGIFQFNGPEHFMEVAGADLGVNGASSGNFGMAQLIVGNVGVDTTLTLVDLIDNNAAHDPEALYLFGSGGLDGLQILGGSTLVLGDIPVYAFLDGAWEDLHTLFGPGDTVVAFTTTSGTNDGFLALSLVIPVPSALPMGMAVLTLLAARRTRSRAA